MFAKRLTAKLSTGWAKRSIPVLVLWVFSLLLIYSTTSIGNFLVGTDLHLEYYFASIPFNSSTLHAYNSALSITLLVPFLSSIFHISVLDVLKYVFPFIYSFVPVVLYFIFKHYVSGFKAFLGTLLFIVVPTFFIEVTGIGREQIGELFFVLCILSLLKKCYALYVIFGILTALAHYSMGFILYFYLIMIPILGIIAWIWTTRPHLFDWKQFIGALLIIGVSFGILSSISGGIAVKSAAYVGASYVSPISNPSGENPNPYDHTPILNQYLDLSNRDSLVQTALGMDFFKVPIEGKIFRIIQFTLEILIGFGLILSLKKRWFPLVGASACILIFCVAIPSFASILNPSRFYHIAMFFLPLGMITASEFVFKRYWKITLSGLILVYFVFTSGVVFEILKLNPDKVDIPYSIALSHDRLDLGTKYENSDVEAGKYLNSLPVKPVYADVYGLVIIQESLGLKPLYLIQDKIPDDSYIFLRVSNVETGTITVWLGAGLRKYVPYSVNRQIVWQEGNSIIYGPVSYPDDSVSVWIVG